MRARIIWFPSPEGKAKSAVVEVTPDELATLRSALKLPPESLARATAKIRTYKNGSIAHITYPLCVVSSIRPFRPSAGKHSSRESGKEESE